MQYNKRDLTSILTVEELNARLNPEGRFDWFESVAVDGTGVFETLKAITKLTLRSLRKRMAAQEGAAAPAPGPAQTPMPAAKPTVAFNPAALTAAAAEGLGTPALAAMPPVPRATAQSDKTLPGATVKPPPVALEPESLAALAGPEVAPPGRRGDHG